jgi:hypothetical protein
MVLWLVIGAVLVVLLGAAALTDRKSKRVRGRVPRVRVPGGELSHRTDLLASEQLSRFDAGQSMSQYMQPPHDDVDRG